MVVSRDRRMFKLSQLALLGALWPLSALAAWTEVSSRHLIVYSEGSQEETRTLVEQLERLDQSMR